MSTIFRLRVGGRIADRQEEQMQLVASRIGSHSAVLGGDGMTAVAPSPVPVSTSPYPATPARTRGCP